MPIEKDLAKLCQISWLDARDLATETKVKLGVSSIPQESKKDEYERFKAAAVDVWESKSDDEKAELRKKAKQSKQRVKQERETRLAELDERVKQEPGLTHAEGAGILALICCCCPCCCGN